MTKQTTWKMTTMLPAVSRTAHPVAVLLSNLPRHLFLTRMNPQSRRIHSKTPRIACTATSLPAAPLLLVPTVSPKSPAKTTWPSRRFTLSTNLCSRPRPLEWNCLQAPRFSMSPKGLCPRHLRRIPALIQRTARHSICSTNNLRLISHRCPIILGCTT